VTLHTMMPFAPDLNLGAAYNAAMELVPEGDWVCFLDHDAMWTTREWYRQLTEAIAFKPDAGVMTAVTNRIAAPWQQVGDRNNHDMGYHVRLGHQRLERRSLLDISRTKGFGGVVMVLSKAVWREVGGFVDGLLCVDHTLHFALQRLGRPAYLLESLYVYHRRRAFVGELPPDTPRVANCPCRGPEEQPTARIPLP
jgi:glycosyltransferase involved in cell wall biosynthesis